MNLLLVEDEKAVADFIRRGLKAEGWLIEHVEDGETALDRLKENEFDVVVLDLMLPGISGQDVCRKMRARKNFTPILMLTALDARDELVEGLRLGADDYLTKPFDFDELIARLESLNRREQQYRSGQNEHVISCGELEIDRQSLIVRLAGAVIDLTAKEREILTLLATNSGRVISRERILNTIWDASEDPLTNVVDVYVGRLRKKLGTHGDLIQTVRGIGYRVANKE